MLSERARSCEQRRKDGFGIFFNIWNTIKAITSISLCSGRTTEKFRFWLRHKRMFLLRLRLEVTSMQMLWKLPSNDMQPDDPHHHTNYYMMLYFRQTHKNQHGFFMSFAPLTKERDSLAKVFMLFRRSSFTLWNRCLAALSWTALSPCCATPAFP